MSMEMTRRHALGLLGVAGIGAAGLLAPLARAAAGSDAQLAKLDLRIANYKGDNSYFLKEAALPAPPYRTSYAEFAGGNLIVEAISAGAIDVGGMSEIPPVFAADNGTPLRVIAVLRGDVNNQVTLVPGGSTIRDAADLKGKRVGYVRSTTSHYFLLRLLREKGLSFADITPVALSPQDGLAAFQSGQLDAWVIYGLVVQFALAGGARVLKTAQGYLSGNYLVAAHKDALNDPLRRAAIGIHLKREQQVYQWITANPEKWAARSAQITGVPKAIFLDEFRQRSTAPRLVKVDDAAIRSQQGVADLFADAGVIPKRVNVAPLWDKRLNDVLG
ncbi:putative aliphatic sulfonates-binding protein [Andreprevotia sp. IGB-42]|uniref:ABC transporter substrate-binding protein n=1 Tax=Andreprevotia sp. IGB-42 TaxID=2497473 RepID=UPI00157EB206|nr:ABC transporter substrate-binding protein [Andreprevotia sp. IGB-42]KAF0812648.1 putative aliphatic sulfonates-binding protein [Andreprevotia sp. IGB-42]